MVAIAAADTDRLLGDWAIQGRDSNDNWMDSQAGPITAARGVWLWDNDPISHAITETLLAGAIGPVGLTFRSRYAATDDGILSPEEESGRHRIDTYVRRATVGKRFDARGQFSTTELLRIQARHALCTGQALSVRLWKPERPEARTATCVGLIHSARICNEKFGPNTRTCVNGVVLDGDGRPTAYKILRSHPNAHIRDMTWDTVPIFAPDGTRNIADLSCSSHPDAYRGQSWYTQVIPLLRFLGRTLEAKVIADVMKASIGFVIECEDPEQMAKADRNGAVLTKTSKIKPGMKYYVKKGTNWKEFNLNFNGADFENWGDFLLKLICANFRIPYEFVLNTLTKTNLAASRVALIQAYNTFRHLEQWVTTNVLDVWHGWIIQEGIARGELDLPLPDGDTDRLYRSHYLPPPRPFPDPKREADANATRRKELRVSLSTIHSESGTDLDLEAANEAADRRTLARHGVADLACGTIVSGNVIGDDGVPSGGSAPAADPENPADAGTDPCPTCGADAGTCDCEPLPAETAPASEPTDEGESA